MIELLKAKRVLDEYWHEQERISAEYNIDNQEYLNGLYDALRIIEKCANSEINAMFENEDITH